MPDSPFYIAFGRKLASARRQRGLNQGTLAEVVGISRASVANIEAGKQRVFLDQAMELAAAVGATDLSELTPEPSGLSHSAKRPSLTGASRLSREQERMLSRILTDIGEG